MSSNLIRNISNKNYDAANKILSEHVSIIMEKKLFELKKNMAAKMCEQMGLMGPSRAEKLRTGVLEEDELDEAIDPKEDSMSVERGTPKQQKNTTVVPKNNMGGPGSTHYKNMKEEEHLDEMQVGKSSGISNMAKDMRLSQEPKWNETNKNLRGFHNPEPRLPNADPDPHSFRSNTPVYSIAPNKQAIAKYVKPNLEEETEEQLDEARVKIVKARIRGGKIQRRKKVSNVEGYKVQGGQLKRMSPTERRHRKLGQKRGKIKRRSKMTRTLMKRQKSIRKRQSLGI